MRILIALLLLIRQGAYFAEKIDIVIRYGYGIRQNEFLIDYITKLTDQLCSLLSAMDCHGILKNLNNFLQKGQISSDPKGFA